MRTFLIVMSLFVFQVQGDKEIAWADQSMNETVVADPLVSSSSSTSLVTATPGPDAQFDIHRVLDFPIMSVANLTREFAVYFT